jgi:uncharacterized protein YndB with AHSA1/START domain
MTTTSTREAEITVDPDVPLVRIVREFDAPVAKVFRAHVDPELFLQWQGPDDLESEIERFDCRTGGSWRYVSRRGDDEFWFYGSYHEVRENELIVQTFCFEGVPDGVALEKVVFEDLGDGRTRLVATSLVDDFAGRDAFVASGMETGVQQGYRRLDTILEGLS